MTKKSIRLGELVDRFGGQLIGDADTLVSGIAPLSDADAHQLSFLSNSKLRKQAETTNAAGLIVTEADHLQIGDLYQGSRIVAPNPYVYFAHVAQFFESIDKLPVNSIIFLTLNNINTNNQ